MITLRFPSGVAVTYNDANFLQYKDPFVRLMTAAPEKQGRLVAVVPYSSGVVVGFVKPCRVEDVARKQTIEGAVELLVRDIRSARNTSEVARLKLALRAFNAKRHAWK